jgi:GTP:adenosylcobinamide-phosphate guanylyltransferase/aminoglycoside phosphotransferase
MTKAGNRVIVQAGGKGTRLGRLTLNRPKCLVPVRGRPLLYHLATAFPGSHFTIISDYQKSTLARYLETVPPPFDYNLVESRGIGTCCGIEAARSSFGKGGPLTIVWSDLLFDAPLTLPSGSGVHVGVCDSIPCRWQLDDGVPTEREGPGLGIIGLFHTEDESTVPAVPKEGEFVRFLGASKVTLVPWRVANVQEVGTLAGYEKLRSFDSNSRFFNDVVRVGDSIRKSARNDEYRRLLDDEVRWYQFVTLRGFPNIPKIRSYQPLEMEYIPGWHPYELANRSLKERLELLEMMLAALRKLHALQSVPTDGKSEEDVYFQKTVARLDAVKHMFPWERDTKFVVNGQLIRNFAHPDHASQIRKVVERLGRAKELCVIHGDPTFSNIRIDSRDLTVRFIDPRGYFGLHKIFGDSRYDYAKLYYSVVGNYDAFNTGRFALDTRGGSVAYSIESSGWEDCGGVFDRIPRVSRWELDALHALIWLSLTGYVREDYDGVLVSFARGCELMEKVLDG